MDAVVATSAAYVESSQILRTHVPAKNLKVIPLGIVESSYAAATMEAHEISVESRFGLATNGYFLSLGVLRYYKGLHTLLEAAKTVDFQIVIAGDGPMRNELERAAARLLPAGRVLFLGHVSDAEKIALIKGCLAFVLPSHLRSEAFGMVLIESSMLGKPMITCEISTGTSFVNSDGETGLVVPPESDSALAFAMRRFVADKSFTENCGARARNRYELLFSGEHLGRSYVDLYHELLAA